MKIKTIFMLVVVVMLLGLSSAQLSDQPQYPGARMSATTVQNSAIHVATVTADASALTSTTSSWTHCKALFTPIPTEWGTISLSFYGFGDGDGVGSPNNATYAYKVFLCDLYGGATLITNGTGAIGAQQMSHTPDNGTELNSGAVSANYTYSDTITEGSVYAERDVTYTDFAAADGQAMMHIKRYSAYGVYVVISSMTAQPVTSITCTMQGFNQ